MFIASSDPLNFILATVWSVVMFGCGTFAWVAYVWWKCRPYESISQRIAAFGLRQQDNFRIALVIGLMIGNAGGVVLGMFVGHWFWPVEITP